MNKKTLKRIAIWIASIVGVCLVVYLGLVFYVVYSFSGGCGMDDGPFIAVKTKPVKITKTSERFPLSDGGELVITNRQDALPPVLTLLERGKVKWTLNTDVRNTDGYQTSTIREVYNVSILQDTDPIKLKFTANWTGGAEAGSINIDRESGENSFCLSW